MALTSRFGLRCCKIYSLNGYLPWWTECKKRPLKAGWSRNELRNNLRIRRPEIWLLFATHTGKSFFRLLGFFLCLKRSLFLSLSFRSHCLHHPASTTNYLIRSLSASKSRTASDTHCPTRWPRFAGRFHNQYFLSISQWESERERKVCWH